ncbi:single-stranded DNA-binding protein [Kitasatospora sp. RB6PN24]|uniref:single-stranded DNA-binding protein n=1 Tax=Kitasatospora humi TaxID=2893891 RepID=UPI001E2B821B|nr:single-stranded DNA-binding protein [Kitasatospora humi]MCC9306323.1 single-stranded DNA-binding protein [Kitasatospora humi]
MNETVVTMIGNVASPVQYGQTAGGIPMANFRLASTERRYDRGRAEWVDGDTLWVTVLAWRGLASNVVSSLGKGDPVVVSGRLRVREWEDEGKRRSVVEIDARAIGHDLGRGTSAFRPSVRGRSEVAGVQSAGEAVPEWITQAVRERRAHGGQASLAGAVGEQVAAESVGWAGVISQGAVATGHARAGGSSGGGTTADEWAVEPSSPVARRRRSDPALEHEPADVGQRQAEREMLPGLVGDPAAVGPQVADGAPARRRRVGEPVSAAADTAPEEDGVLEAAATGVAARGMRGGRLARSGRGGRAGVLAGVGGAPASEEEALRA